MWRERAFARSHDEHSHLSTFHLHGESSFGTVALRSYYQECNLELMTPTCHSGQLEARMLVLTEALGQRVPKLRYSRLESDHVCIAKQLYQDCSETKVH